MSIDRPRSLWKKSCWHWKGMKGPHLHGTLAMLRAHKGKETYTNHTKINTPHAPENEIRFAQILLGLHWIFMIFARQCFLSFDILNLYNWRILQSYLLIVVRLCNQKDQRRNRIHTQKKIMKKLLTTLSFNQLFFLFLLNSAHKALRVNSGTVKLPISAHDQKGVFSLSLSVSLSLFLS